MNLDQDFFQVTKLSEDKKNVFTRNGTLFSPNSSTDLRSYAHQNQIIKIIGGDAGEDHTQIVGGIQSNYWGIHPLPRVSAPLSLLHLQGGLKPHAVANLVYSAITLFLIN